MLLLSLFACSGREPSSDARPLARVDDEILDERIVELVAERDGVDPNTAREQALDTLRLVAARRAELAEQAGEPQPELEPSRAAQLVRAAKARLWLRTHFEPHHRSEDIARDDPDLLKARSDLRWVRERPVYEVCQLVVVPETGPREPPDDPAWRAAAQALLSPIADRIARIVPPGHPQTCMLVARILQASKSSDGQRRVRFEGAGFDLDACAEQASDGTCTRRLYAEEWTSRVRTAETPGLLPAFFTRFGLHLVYLHRIVPPQPAAASDTERIVRESIHLDWQRRAFSALLQALRRERAVRIVPDLAAMASPDRKDPP